MTQILIGLFIAALVVLVIVRRFGTRKVGSEARLLVLPLVVVAVAITQVDMIDGDQPLLSGSLLGLGVVAGLGLGAGLGYTMRLWYDGSGTLWSRGTRFTALVFVATLLVRAGLIGLGFALGMALSTGATLVFVAVWLLAQNLVIIRRTRTMLAPAVSVNP